MSINFKNPDEDFDFPDLPMEDSSPDSTEIDLNIQSVVKKARIK